MRASSFFSRSASAFLSLFNWSTMARISVSENLGISTSSNSSRYEFFINSPAVCADAGRAEPTTLPGRSRTMHSGIAINLLRMLHLSDVI